MIVLCLVNTYDKLKLHEIHLRTIARAAPLCYAYGLHLALMGFEFWDSEEEMVRQVAEYTTIGDHGRYAVELLKEGKIHLIDKIPGHFGEVVATTPEPDREKRVGFEEICDIIRRKSVTFLMGLGRRGLPRDMVRKAKYHYDVTEKGICLETCSAMGAVATAIWFAKRWLDGGNKILSGTRVLQRGEV